MAPKSAADVSVVIPYFNSNAVIERALMSVANQTVLPREVLVVDDGSSDLPAIALERVIKSFEAFESFKVRRIRLQLNRGAASARNAGWSASIGKYIAFLDSDDSWHPSKLELQVRHMDANTEVMLCAHAHDARSESEPWDSVPNAPVAALPVTAQMLLIRNRFITPSVMLRRDISQRFEDDQRHMEDHLLWSKIAISGAKIDYLPVALARIHKRITGEGGLSNQLVSMQLADMRNYWKLREQGHLGFFMTFVYSLFSLAKFVRRIALITLWRCRRLFGASQ